MELFLKEFEKNADRNIKAARKAKNLSSLKIKENNRAKWSADGQLEAGTMPKAAENEDFTMDHTAPMSPRRADRSDRRIEPDTTATRDEIEASGSHDQSGGSGGSDEVPSKAMRHGSAIEHVLASTSWDGGGLRLPPTRIETVREQERRQRLLKGAWGVNSARRGSTDEDLLSDHRLKTSRHSSTWRPSPYSIHSH